MPYKDKEKKREKDRQYREANKEKIKSYMKSYQATPEYKEYKKELYTNKRFNKYGITKEDFSELLEVQQHCCAICRSQFSVENRPHIDHCHETQIVRGLLCLHCNTGLGQFKDNIELLDKAKEYIKTYEDIRNT